jgi:hypothetical protein
VLDGGLVYDCPAYGLGSYRRESRGRLAIEKPVAAADALVVALKAEDRSAEKQLAALGRIDSVGVRRWALRLHAPGRDPRQAWRAVLAQNPEAEWVAPAFRDASGNELLPTGAVAVRFRKKPSDRALEAFARDEALELDRRNEFVPEQATFHPREPRDVYLPDLVAKLASRPEVAAVWPATSSRYRKA